MKAHYLRDKRSNKHLKGKEIGLKSVISKK